MTRTRRSTYPSGPTRPSVSSSSTTAGASLTTVSSLPLESCIDGDVPPGAHPAAPGGQRSKSRMTSASGHTTSPETTHEENMARRWKLESEMLLVGVEQCDASPGRLVATAVPSARRWRSVGAKSQRERQFAAGWGEG